MEEEFENIFKLQNSENTTLVANELIKPHFDEYCNWLTDKILNKVDEYNLIKNRIEIDGYWYTLNDTLREFFLFGNDTIKILRLQVTKSNVGVRLHWNHSGINWSKLSNDEIYYFQNKLPSDIGNLNAIIETHLVKRRRKLLGIIKALLTYMCYNKFK